MDIKELLDKGFSADEISEMFESELATVMELEAEKKAKAAQAEEENAKRNETLSTARAHLISAIDMYNEVFDFFCFDGKTAETLEALLIEIENWLKDNREAVDVYIKLAQAQEKSKSKGKKGRLGFNLSDLLF